MSAKPIEHPPEWYNCECPICHKKFHLKQSHVKICKHNYCSRKCFYESKHETMSGKSNHQYGLKGSNNPTWKSDEMINRYGYRMVRVLDHPFKTKKRDMVLEHRLIAEKFLLTEENSVVVDGKRYLSPEYIVHHKNHNRLDNRVENLVVMKKAEHSKMHYPETPRNRDKITGRFIKNVG